MPFPSEAGNVKLGKGSLLLDRLTDAGVSTGFSFVGDVSSLTLSAEKQEAEIYSSSQATAPLLKKATTRLAFNLSATLHEYTKENLQSFLLAEEAAKTQTLNNSASVTIAAASVFAGRIYDTGARRITNVVVTQDGTDVLTVDTDYIVYSEFGVVHLLTTGAARDGVETVIEFDQPALEITQLRLLQQASPVVHLLFLADDANTDGAGSKDRLECWKCAIAPEGDLNLISDDFGSFQLSMSVQSDATNHPNDPYGTLDRIAA